MSTYFTRGEAPSGSFAAQPPRTARSAALLIDFDNVTLGVHTDLGRELKNLINSEIFRGKIAVRRAYADWRRYPNYVVPLTEASIDLIFAPAYGSSKKNTTDLRMSADAIELAFTRPEIDTFILLTGDSDFSSTVMKLKEYGKYVIGVGMRESSSDLIIQNCDEYFSYHALTGLTRARAGEGMREDPWELAARAVRRMVAGGDAMRSDRLKQVMLSMDPGFNEKELGYPKFSRFVSEAEKKGLLKLHKLPDGQYEISIDGGQAAVASVAATPAQPAPPAPEAAAATDEVQERRGPRPGRRDRRGDRDRERRRPAELPGEAAAPAEEPVVAAEVSAPAAPEAVPAPAAPVAAPAGEGESAQAQHAMSLLQRAVRALASKAGGAVRDGDVKRKMLEFEPAFDEASLGYGKFSRFLRFAHDQEAIDLVRLDGGQYEVSMGARAYAAPPLQPQSEPRAPAATGLPSPSAAPEAAPAPAPEKPAAPAAAQPPASLRGRHRHRGGLPDAGPPPLLPGQVIAPVAPTLPAEPAAQEPVAAERKAPEATPAEPTRAAEPRRRRDRRGRKATEAAPAEPLAVAVEPAVEAVSDAAAESAEAAPAAAAEEPTRKRRRGGRGRKARAEAAESAPATFSPAALGLPRERAEVEAYLTREYKGVGKKTVEPLLDAFGDDIFRVFAEEPARVAEVIGDRRAATVLEQWTADYARRGEGAPAAPAAESETPAPEAETPAEKPTAPAEKPAARSRRRGGRGRKREAGAAEVAAPEPTATQDEPATEPVAETKAGAEAAATPARTRGRGRGRSKKSEAGTPAEQPAAEAAASAAAEAEPPPAKPRSRGRGRGGRARKSQPAST